MYVIIYVRTVVFDLVFSYQLFTPVIFGIQCASEIIRVYCYLFTYKHYT